MKLDQYEAMASFVESTQTPANFAKAFWSWDTEKQMEFFSELRKVIDADEAACDRPMACFQWAWLGSDMQDNDVARNMLMEMSAHLYLHTLDYVEKNHR